MGVYHQTFIVYGWEIGIEEYDKYGPEPEDDCYENKLEEKYSYRDSSKGDVAVIYDGRSGKYCYFGIIVASSNSTRNGPQSFDKRHKLTGNISKESMMELGEAVGEMNIETEGEPNYHVFTHVT